MGAAGSRCSRSVSPSASIVVSRISPPLGALISFTPFGAAVQRERLRSPRRSDQTLYTLP
jgi:hypothetical protein